MRFMVLTGYVKIPLINAHADISSEARGLNFGLSIHLCMQAVKVLASQHIYICADSLEPSLLDVIITEMWCTGPDIHALKDDGYCSI